MTRREIELLNKRLNNRMRQLEKSGLTSSRDYKELENFAKKSGATKTKSGKVRFKENLKTAEKKGELKTSEKFSKLGSFYGGTKKQEALKDIRDRMQSKGKAKGIADPETLSDILESQKSTKGESSLWNSLKQYFDSDQIIEIFNQKKEGTNIKQRLEWIENAFSGEIMNETIVLHYLKGFINETDVNHFLDTGELTAQAQDEIERNRRLFK